MHSNIYIFSSLVKEKKMVEILLTTAVSSIGHYSLK